MLRAWVDSDKTVCAPENQAFTAFAVLKAIAALLPSGVVKSSPLFNLSL